MAGSWFLTGAGLFYLGIALLAIQVWNLLKSQHWAIQVTVEGLYAICVIIYSLLWIFIPAPLEILPTSYVPQYGSGSTMNGIEWRPYYSELDFSINNLGPNDYDNLSVEVSTDLWFEQVRQIAGLGTCAISTVRPFGQLKVQHFDYGKPTGPVGIGGVEVNGQSYEYKEAPIFPGGKVGLPIGTNPTDKIYRIRCDKLSSNSHIDFVAALSVVNPAIGPGSHLYDAPKAAKWMTLDVTFQDSGRRRHLVISQCQNGSTCDIKRRFDINFDYWTLGLFRPSINRAMRFAVVIYTVIIISCPLAVFVCWLIDVPLS